MMAQALQQSDSAYDRQVWHSNSCDTSMWWRPAVPWNRLKEHVASQFLSADEASSLRDEVEHVRQSDYDRICSIQGGSEMRLMQIALPC